MDSILQRWEKGWMTIKRLVWDGGMGFNTSQMVTVTYHVFRVLFDKPDITLFLFFHSNLHFVVNEVMFGHYFDSIKDPENHLLVPRQTTRLTGHYDANIKDLVSCLPSNPILHSALFCCPFSSMSLVTGGSAQTFCKYIVVQVRNLITNPLCGLVNNKHWNNWTSSKLPYFNNCLFLLVLTNAGKPSDFEVEKTKEVEFDSCW